MLPKTIIWTLTAVPQELGMSFMRRVGDGALVHPGAEDGADGSHELDLGVGGELDAGKLLVEDLEALDYLLHILGGEAGVGGDAAAGP